MVHSKRDPTPALTAIKLSEMMGNVGAVCNRTCSGHPDLCGYKPHLHILNLMAVTPALPFAPNGHPAHVEAEREGWGGVALSSSDLG